MGLYVAAGDANTAFSDEELQELLFRGLANLGKRDRVLLVPPDLSRKHSRAGDLTRYSYQYYGTALKGILPALGTHAAMTAQQLERMFGAVPQSLFRVHHWRTDVEELGEVPASFVEEQSEGKLHYSWPAQVNRLVSRGGFDLILSIGQVVPHEVVGMANYNKNILIGTGGRESINRSHYLGAVYGMERMMGRTDTPVRRVLNYAADRYLQSLPIVYVLTVVGPAEDGDYVVRGLFIGDDLECFERAAALSREVNITLLDEPIRKAVVTLDPEEYHSTWLGNKAIYRTRMALADDAELIILAPGIERFGEDDTIDRLIRRYGYQGTPATLAAVARDQELAHDLSAAAHLIHGSSEGRFRITLCPGHLTRAEVEGVGFAYGDLGVMTEQYNPRTLREGFNDHRDGKVFYTAHPGLGLWSWKGHFVQPQKPA